MATRTLLEPRRSSTSRVSLRLSLPTRESDVIQAQEDAMAVVRAYTKMVGGPAPTVDVPAEAPATKRELTRTLSRQLSRTLSRKVSMTLKPAAEVPAPELADLVTAKDVLMELPPRLPDSEIAKLETSGPMGQVKPYTIVRDLSAWTAADWEGREHEFEYELTSEDLAEVEAALAEATKRELPIQEIRREDFPLPTLGPRLEELGAAAFKGRGFQLVRGLPVDHWTKKQSIMVYWGMAAYWGEARPQSRKGAMVEHVKAAGVASKGAADPGRPQHSPVAHSYHTDSADAVALLCLQQAPEGGLSSWCSSVAVHNEMIKRGRADLVKVLAEADWARDRRGDLAPGGEQAAPWFQIPIVSYAGGNLTTVFAPHLVRMAQRWADAPRLTPEQQEAMDMVTALAGSEELRLQMKLRPGDIQLCYNHTMLHARSTFKDGDGPGEQRHLVRLWLAPREDRELPEEYTQFTGSNEPGARGGIVHAPGARLHVPLDKY